MTSIWGYSKNIMTKGCGSDRVPAQAHSRLCQTAPAAFPLSPVLDLYPVKMQTHPKTVLHPSLGRMTERRGRHLPAFFPWVAMAPRGVVGSPVRCSQPQVGCVLPSPSLSSYLQGLLISPVFANPLCVTVSPEKTGR